MLRILNLKGQKADHHYLYFCLAIRPLQKGIMIMLQFGAESAGSIAPLRPFFVYELFLSAV